MTSAGNIIVTKVEHLPSLKEVHIVEFVEFNDKLNGGLKVSHGVDVLSGDLVSGTLHNNPNAGHRCCHQHSWLIFRLHAASRQGLFLKFASTQLLWANYPMCTFCKNKSEESL